MKNFIVIQGYEKSEVFHTEEGAIAYIQSKLNQHKDLNPVLISQSVSEHTIKDYKGVYYPLKITVLIYCYYTLYTETFAIYATDANEEYPQSDLYDQEKTTKNRIERLNKCIPVIRNAVKVLWDKGWKWDQEINYRDRDKNNDLYLRFYHSNDFIIIQGEDRQITSSLLETNETYQYVKDLFENENKLGNGYLDDVINEFIKERPISISHEIEENQKLKEEFKQNSDFKDLLEEIFCTGLGYVSTFDRLEVDQEQFDQVRRDLQHLASDPTAVCIEDVYTEMLLRGYTLSLRDAEEVDNQNKRLWYNLTLSKVCKGLKLYFASQSETNETITDILDNGDYYDYDAILQYALFDEVIYG